jgi:glycosyltransferase involved in cell wall biosynthesis
VEHLQRSWWQMFQSSPLEVLTHNLPKRFMIITNDGTKGDVVNRRCCLFKRLYDFNFWLNGVDKRIGTVNEGAGARDILTRQGMNVDFKFLLYPARYDPWKRQDLAIEIVTRMNQRGIKPLQLLCCGHVYDQKYFGSLVEKVNEKHMNDLVKLSGALPKDELRILYREALATFSLYDLSNLGNVLIEAAAEGAVLIVRNDGTTEFVIKHGETGFLVKDPSEAVAVILSLLSDPDKHREISDRIKRLADELFETWDQRSDREVELIEKAAGQGARWLYTEQGRIDGIAN